MLFLQYYDDYLMYYEIFRPILDREESDAEWHKQQAEKRRAKIGQITEKEEEEMQNEDLTIDEIIKKRAQRTEHSEL